MKFYKRQSLDYHNPMSNTFAAEEDGRLIADTTQSLRLPSGTVTDRPTDTTRGQIRNNTQAFDLETLVRTTWERVRTVRPATILVQNLGSGNYSSNLFGPLNAGYNLSYVKGAANIQVYVDNVYQIPYTNYDLTTDPSPVIANTTATTTAGSTVLYLDSVFNVQPGCAITGAIGISSSTTVLGTFTGTNNIELSEPVSVDVPATTALTFTFNTGTYIAFAGAVPAKPVVAILGYDGYFPPS
jgi:hypothetical protein